MPSKTDQNTPQTRFSHWAFVELMGHQTVAGLVTEETVAGKAFLRVDIPTKAGETACTRYYSPDAVYCISPIDRQIALGLAAKHPVRPVTIYDLKQLSADKPLGAGNETYGDPTED